MKRVIDAPGDLEFGACTMQEYPVLLESLDAWFDKKEKHWFARNLSHIFRPEPVSVARHNVVRSGGRIVGAIGIYPYTLRIGRASLSVGGVGSVSTSPEHRGLGIMSFMLKNVRRMLDEGGYDVSWLGGDRYRYRNYGWDCAGRATRFSISLRDLLRYHPDLPSVKTRLAGNRDGTVLARLQARFPTFVPRDVAQWRMHLARFRWQLGTSRRGSAYIACSPGSPESLVEAQGEPMTLLSMISKHCAEFRIERISVTYPSVADPVSRRFQHVAAHCTEQYCGQMQVIDPDSTWGKLLPEMVARNAHLGRRVLASLARTTRRDHRLALLDRALGFLDHLPALPRALSMFEPLRPIGWWTSTVDGV